MWDGSAAAQAEPMARRAPAMSRTICWGMECGSFLWMRSCPLRGRANTSREATPPAHNRRMLRFTKTLTGVPSVCQARRTTAGRRLRYHQSGVASDWRQA